MKCLSKTCVGLDAQCSMLDSRCSIIDEYQVSSIKYTSRAFTLIEVMTALAILALISSSVLVVINRCVISATDSALRMHCFEVARDNMEKLLVSESVKETLEYGDSDKYPGIKWQTAVETFYEPITARMWVRGVCSAEYIDSAGQTQTVELTHWIADVTKEQLLQILQQEQGQEGVADQIIETIEEAAEYAGVDENTIQRWIENGMLTFEENDFLIKYNLDIFKNADGKPSDEEKSRQISSIEQILELIEKKSQLSPDQNGGQVEPGQQNNQNVEPMTGLTYQELEKMDISEIYTILKVGKR